MEDFIKRLTSRKFLLTVAVIAGNVLLAVGGAIDWPTAAENIKVVVLGYIVVEGAGDAAGKYSYFRGNK